MTTIIMRNATNWAGDRYLGFYHGKKLVGEVDPRGEKFYVFFGFSRPERIGIHADRDHAIKQLQAAIKAAISGQVKFYMA